MAEPDWTGGELDHHLHAYMVDPLDHAQVLGELEVYADAGTIDWAEESPTLVGASIQVPDWSAWVENSWIRLTHWVGNSYHKVLSTFFVGDEGKARGLDSYTATPELCSCLKGLEGDLLTHLMVVGEGATSRQAISRLLDACPVPYVFGAGFGAGYRWTGAHVFDCGMSRLDALAQMCSVAGAQARPDGLGRVVVSPRSDPADMSSSATIDCRDPHSIVFEGSVRVLDSSRTTAGRSIAVWSGTGDDGEAESVSGYADVSPSNPASPSRRGYTVSAIHELADLPSPRTQAQAQTVARTYLAADSGATKRWSLRTAWLPIDSGCVVDFRPPTGGTRRCLVEGMTQYLGDWTLDLTLKEL